MLRKAGLRMKMNSKKAEVLMVSVTLAWGSSYLLMKIGLEGIGPFNLIALRCGIAFICMAIFFLPHFRKITSSILMKGLLLGILLFLLFAGLVCGVNHTAASTAAFLASTTVLIIPILESILKLRLPDKSVVISVILAVIGLYLLLVKETLFLDLGAIYCLFAAFVYAIYIIVLGRIVKNENTLLISVIQLGVVSLLGVVFALLLENPELPKTTIQWTAIWGLGIFCSAYGFVIQPIAQQYMSSEKVGLIFSLEPVFSTILSFIFLHEVLEVKGYLGAAFIFFSIIFSKLRIKNLISDRCKSTSSL